MLKVGYKKRLFVLWMVFFMCGVEGLECDFEIQVYVVVFLCVVVEVVVYCDLVGYVGCELCGQVDVGVVLGFVWCVV